MRYGSLTAFDEWSADVLHPAHPVDLVLLLVRLCDLEAVHPEMRTAKNSEGKAVASDALDSDVIDDSIKRFINDLERYDAKAVKSTAPPLVVLLCPSPPSSAAMYDVMESGVRSSIKAIQSVSVQPSERLMDLFQQQYATSFYDAVSDKRQHSPYTQAMLNVLSLSLCRQICRLFLTTSSRKKVIVVDCDNTLWGGAVAEAGASNIDLAPRFLALQRFVVKQQERGMLLALCSKNIHKDVVQAFKIRRNEMVLDIDKHIVAAKINWQDKSENIAQLAKELALDSVSTKEDSQRTQLYLQNRQREQLRESTSTHKAFLSALGVKIKFEELDREQELRARSSSFTRALQLHHRTNQFNTATTFAKRMEEQDLLHYIATPGHTVVCAHVTDRFGHYGLVSVALCHRASNSALRVDSFLLSCRALNRGVEHAMMRRLGVIAAKTNAEMLEFVWEPTERNQPAHTFLSALSDTVFVIGKERQPNEKAKQYSGAWVITAEKTTQVSFLKAENRSRRNSGYVGGLPRRILLGKWLQHAALSAFRWIFSFISLPRWMTHLLPPFLFRGLVGVVPTGSLRVVFRDRGSLNQFLVPSLRSTVSQQNFVAIGASNIDSNDDDKFRRKARHQTKLTLVNHLHEEVPRVIWSANRPHTDGNEGATEFMNRQISDEGAVVQIQLVCESPQCSAIIQRDGRCAFGRCRTCCYRIQRLIARSLHHANAEARQSAVTSLQIEFALNTAQAAITEARTQLCKAHQNKRRRGEIFNRKNVVDTQ
ncbi:unnamed protein product [Phytophthora fragariaefolia]|uniref:Unnamed protein product n=1 Tax=Phytophthora fragariaefolia TaxID=1490495 RepID=A0A9W6UBP8_9STRA|nr:unnamed protein product [Phytophthora fragariaefolia]